MPHCDGRKDAPTLALAGRLGNQWGQHHSAIEERSSRLLAGSPPGRRTLRVMRTYILVTQSDSSAVDAVAAALPRIPRLGALSSISPPARAAAQCQGLVEGPWCGFATLSPGRSRRTQQRPETLSLPHGCDAAGGRGRRHRPKRERRIRSDNPPRSTNPAMRRGNGRDLGVPHDMAPQKKNRATTLISSKTVRPNGAAFRRSRPPPVAELHAHLGAHHVSSVEANALPRLRW